VIIHSENRYGQLAVSGAGIGQQTTVVASGLGAAATGFYQDVITGVLAEGIANEGEITAGGHGMLSVLSKVLITPFALPSGPADAWNLEVLNFGQDMAEPQAFFLKQNWLSVRQSLDYDCDQFGQNGASVSFMSQYDSYDAENIGGGSYGELSGTLLGAKRLTENLRIGGLLDWRVSGKEIQGIDNENRLPIMGAFVGYSQGTNGTGLQARFSGAYEHGKADFSHASLLGSAALSGEASFDTSGVGVETGWGFALKGQQVVTPFVSINYVTTTRDEYSDKTAGSAAADQFSYDSYSEEYATGTMGVRLKGQVASKVDYLASVGLESVLSGDTDGFGLHGQFGGASYQSQNAISDLSLKSSAGIAYKVSDFDSVTLSGYLRQMEGGEIHSGVSLGYKKGF